MSALEEVMAKVTALKKDLEDIGVGVTTSIMIMPTKVDYKVALNIRILMRKDLEEAEDR